MICAMHQWISLRYTCVDSLLNLPHHLPPHPSLVCHRESFGSPVSSSKFPLIIYFTCGKYMFQCLCSQIIPPSVSLAVPKVYSICLHLHCYHVDRLIIAIFLDFINMHLYKVFVFLFLIYFNIE